MKTKKFTPVTIALILLALAIAMAACGAFLTRNIFINGERFSLTQDEYDLRAKGLTSVAGLERCRHAKTMDIRENGLSLEECTALAAALPNCEVRYDVPLGGTLYDSFLTELSLSALPDDWENLVHFSKLTTLRVEQCSDATRMAALQQALPHCQIIFCLSLGSGWYPSDSRELTLTDNPGYAVLLEGLRYFPELSSLTLFGTPLSPDEQRAMQYTYPDIAFHWDVAVGNAFLQSDTETAALTPECGFTAEDVLSASDLLPALKTLDLSGSTLSGEARQALREQHPEYDITWTVIFGDRSFPCDTAEIDLSGAQFSSFEEADTILSLLPLLESADLCDCSLSYDDLNTLRARYPEKHVVWRVSFANYELRTDAKYFIASDWEGGWDLTDRNIWPICYCNELEALDLGHMPICDLSFLENLPKMRYLILAECDIYDISPLANLHELSYLEIFHTHISNLSPLLSCEKLLDLNICYTELDFYSAYDTLCAMTWLERIWYCGSRFSPNMWQHLQELNPDRIMFYIEGGESTGGSWRYHEHYYEMRDFFEMYYMPGGTNDMDDDGCQIIVDDAGTEFHLDHWSGEARWWEEYPEYHPYIIGVTA